MPEQIKAEMAKQLSGPEKIRNIAAFRIFDKGQDDLICNHLLTAVNEPVESSVIALPLVLPPTVLGFYLLVLLGPHGPLGKLTMAVVGETLVFRFEGLVIGSLIYWLGSKLMGGSAGFMQALSVWVYSSLPPTVISLLANFVVLFLKNPDDIDIATSSRGVIQANPSMLMDGKETPVLTTLVSSIDLFAIWGWVLAAIGLGVVAKLSKGSAWGIVAILALVGITLRVIFSLINGIPQ